VDRIVAAAIEIADAERFPALAELSAAGTFNPRGDDAGGAALFDFGLARVLDGVEVLVRARSQAADAAHCGHEPE
jgi:hypothetical protein